MAAADDKALIASSDFDPAQFVQGINVMVSGLDRVIAKEAQLNEQLAAQQKTLGNTAQALQGTTTQMATLDKTSAGYSQNLQKLTQQQQQLQQQQAQQAAQLKETQAQAAAAATSADKYKNALAGIGEVAKEVRASGANLFNSATLTTQLQQVNQLAGSFHNIFQGKVNTQELDDLEAKLASTGDEFEKLRDIVGFVEQKLSTLDPNTKEFQDLTTVVKTGNDVLAQFAKVSGNVEQRTQSVKGRIRELRAEMAAMQAAGKQDTDEFVAMEHEAGDLQNSLDKTNERIHNFSNETRGIEVAVEAIRGIAAGFELAEGASALFGVKNEAVEESIKRLNAIMAISNGLQEISNLLKKESILRLGVEEAATKAYAISQRVLAVTLGSTAAASRGLATALAATGVGVLIVGIGILLSLLSSWTDKTKEQIEAQERLNEANKLGLDINEDYINQLEAGLKVEESLLQRRQAANQKVRQSDVERIQEARHNAEQLRTIQEESLKQQIEQNNNELESQRGSAEAAQAQLDEILQKNRAAQEEFDRATNTLQQHIARNKFKDVELIEPLQKTIGHFNELTKKGFDLQDKQEIQQNQFQRDRSNERIELRRAELAAFEDFQKRLVELQKRLTDAQNKQATQDADTLTKAATANLNAELRSLDREVVQKKLTSGRAEVLKNVLRQINGVELATELREFEKKARDAQQTIEDSILDLRLTSAQQRASLLEDELQKEAASIQVSYRQEFVRLEKERRDALEQLQQSRDITGLISPAQFETDAARIKADYAELFANLELITAQKQDDLARLSFEKGRALLKQLFAESGVAISEATNQEILAVTNRYTSGSIRYDRYQRELTRILRRESRARIDQQIAEANEELAALQRRVATETNTEERKSLNDEIIALREQIAQLKRQLAGSEAEGTKADHDEFVRKVNVVASYAQAIGSVVDQVVRFWQLANEAEQKSLDRSITLQERRVEAARRVAERGNAQYLRLEEDRLNELQVKQENAARKQLAINAVLQASQALVAFTTALAQGISTGGPLGGLAIAAAVLGVIASGYSIIKSLQQAQNSSTKLFKGTKRVEARNGEPTGVDTIPALLTAGEAVLPVHTANAYRPAVDAIYDHQIDPQALNTFVLQNRVGRRQLPRLATDRMAEAGEVHLAFEAGLVQAYHEQGRKIDETNDRLATMTKVLKHLGVSVNLDRKGLAISLLEAVQHQRLTKKL